MMVFPQTSSPRKPFCIVDVMVYTAVCALLLAGLHPSFDAVGVAVLLLTLGSLLWWLSWVGASVPWLDFLVLPIFLALALVYMFLILVVFCGLPELALSVLLAQVIAMIYASLRW
jgi:hypothetical protein